MQLERSTADRPIAEPSDEQRTVRRRELVCVGGDTEPGIEARLEAHVELIKVLFDAPPGIGRRWIPDGEPHHDACSSRSIPVIAATSLVSDYPQLLIRCDAPRRAVAVQANQPPSLLAAPHLNSA
jgi:hypothetical protein